MPKGTELRFQANSTEDSEALRRAVEGYFLRPVHITQLPLGNLAWKWESLIDGKRVAAGTGPDMTYWAAGVGSAVAGGVKAIKNVRAKKKEEEKAEAERKKAEVAAIIPNNSEVAELQSVLQTTGIEMDASFLNILNSYSDEDIKNEEAQARARQRELQKLRKKPMPAKDEIVISLQECDTSAEKASREWDGELEEEWRKRRKKIIDYANSHYAGDSAYVQYMATKAQEKAAAKQEINDMKRQKRRKNLRFLGIAIGTAFVLCLFGPLGWILAILGLIIVPVVRSYKNSDNEWDITLKELDYSHRYGEKYK
jgi:uncharacterized protein YdcH (DUF465 family)